MAKNDEPLFVDPNLLQRAEQQCKQQLKNDSENRAVLRSLAEIYRKLGNLGQAAVVYDRLFGLHPQDQEAGYLRALFGGTDCAIAPSGMRAAPFVLLKDFLPRDFHEGLLPFVTAGRNLFAPAGVGRQAQENPDLRQTLQFPGVWEGTERFKRHLLEVLPHVTPRLRLGAFEINPGKVQIQVRAYLDGHFYKVHMDSPPNSSEANRIINFVYYFHRIPRAYSGGELLVFDSDIEADTFTRSRFTRIVPEDNSIVFFPSPYYHSVLPVSCPSKEFADSRFAINGHLSKRVLPKTTMDASAEPGSSGSVLGPALQ